MDKLTKVLMSIDAIKNQFSRKNKRHADDYYELVSAIDENTFKVNDGSLVSFIELRGFSRILSNSEKYKAAQNINESLLGFISRRGLSIQIVDMSDPDLTHEKVSESMKESIDELKRMGIGHPMFTTDYVDFIANRTTWKEQVMVIQTGIEAAKDLPKSKVTKEEEVERESQLKAADELFKSSTNEQGVLLSPLEMKLKKEHMNFQYEVLAALTKAGSIAKKMDVSQALYMQKKSLYGPMVPTTWKPTLGKLFVSKEEQSQNTNNIKVSEARLVEQVIDTGATEENLPPDILMVGDRYISTMSLVVPQDNESKLKAYADLIARLPKNVGYIASYRMETNPFSGGSYMVEKFYTGISTIIPGTNNLIIRRARTEMEDLHADGSKPYVALQLSITLHAKSLDALRESQSKLNSAVMSWNGAKFRNVELDKTQGLMDTLPGVSKQSHLKTVFESFTSAIYQSPLFLDGLLYESGYLHLFTEQNQPFPLEEQSAKNINFNAFFTGTSGSGKSTLLTLFNLALLAKPKLDSSLRGEFPLIMDVDFGKTSFGFKETLAQLVGKSKSSKFLIHEMGTDANSAINPHDLPFGRLTPTDRHKEVLTRFLLVLISGITEDQDGKVKLTNPSIEAMIKNLIDKVYDYCREENSPKKFEEAEFKHQDTITYLKKIGIKYNSDFSYYHLSDLVMEKDPKGGILHAMQLRKYGYPRLSDYNTVMLENSDIAARYSKGVISEGLSPKDFFIERMAQVGNEFPCFTRVTKINTDFARMISIDIDKVCGESSHRKAIFGSLCLMLFMVKRENLEESPELLEGVPKQYHWYLKRLDRMNRVLPGALNIEEAHILYSLFNASLVKAHRVNRKAGWGMRTLSQNLTDPSDELFSLCSTVIIASEQTGDEAERRFKTMNVSREEKKIIEQDLNNRRIFAYIKTKPSSDGINVSRIAVSLKAIISPGLIWSSNSDQVDRAFKKSVVDKFGVLDGMQKLCVFLPSGNVKGQLSKKSLLELARSEGFDTVMDFLIYEMEKTEKPSDILHTKLAG